MFATWQALRLLWSSRAFLLLTAYIVRDGRLYFHFVYQFTSGGGYPSQVQMGEVPQPGPDGEYPGQVQTGGVPWGTPPGMGTTWPGPNGGRFFNGCT